MKFVSRMTIFILLLSAGVWTAMAELMPVEPGSVDVYTSDNGKYEVAIIYGDGLPSWSLKEDGQELWSKPMMDEPGAASVSDNGETITLPLWGWRDEGGSSGVAVYDKEGELVKKIYFKGLSMSEETLRWVRVTKISPDGKYLAIGGNGQYGATVTLFRSTTGELVWEKAAGLPDIVDLKIAVDGKYVLAATREKKDTGMEFVLFDSEGTVLWNKKIDNNLSYDVEHYIRFTDEGTGFEIYDLGSEKYLYEKI